MKKISLILSICLLFLFESNAQYGYWQQAVDYTMDIDFDVKKNRFDGVQLLKYTNNSPESLDKVYYHLYFNAFQPGSVMDERNKTLPDSDKRVAGRISKLSKKEIGYTKVKSLKLNGKEIEFFVNGTILEVDLPTPIKSGETVRLEMDFESQVPIQIRRNGRDNAEGVRYSMAQWYPKICEYDYMGWHPNPYIGREFHSPWGDFTVNITIDKDYVLGATGVLQNYNEIGKGYQPADMKVAEPKGKTLTWQYKAENVIDFVWAADPDYKVIQKRAHDGTRMYFVFQPGEKTSENWSKLPGIMDEALRWMNKRYGKYPYPQYSFIQAGDGGMEYPMATLITGHRSLGSLVGVSVHEWMHSWYQMVLATNEALYPWMDEGFTSYGSAEVMNHLREKGILAGDILVNPHYNSIRGYARFASSGREEALSTHADHYVTNTAYGVGSYTKGAVFLSQLNYIIGKEAFDAGMKRYFEEWKYKHPNPNDFIRVMEKTSDLELDWFKEYWVNTTHTIDYAIDSIVAERNITTIHLSKKGLLPMPIDIQITLDDGSTHNYYIPLRIMRGEKDKDIFKGKVQKDWPWTHPNYSISLDYPLDKIAKVGIDPSGRLADIDISNNEWPQKTEQEGK